MAKKYEGMAKILAIIGGLLGFIEAIMVLAGNPFGPSYSVAGNIVGGIIALLIALVVLFAIFKPGDPIPYNGTVLLIMGIIMIVFSSMIGGILVLVAGILLLI